MELLHLWLCFLAARRFDTLLWRFWPTPNFWRGAPYDENRLSREVFVQLPRTSSYVVRTCEL